jgi:hypothetical protein
MLSTCCHTNFISMLMRQLSASPVQRSENPIRRCLPSTTSSYSPTSAKCQATSGESAREAPAVTRRALHLAAAAAVLGNLPLNAKAASLPKENDASIRLFSSEEEAELEKVSLSK